MKTALAEKESELKSNAAMLARQCDLAREAEIALTEKERELAELREKVRQWGIADKEFKNADAEDIPKKAKILNTTKAALRAAVKGKDEDQ